VLRVLVGARGSRFATAALLLVLLLQRADPALRAAFLNGPEASLLLVTLVTWGCHAQEWGKGRVPGVLGRRGEAATWADGVPWMINQLMEEEVEDSEFTPYMYAASAVLVLVQCYLEPAAARHLDAQQQGQQQQVVLEAGPFFLSTGVSIGEGHDGMRDPMLVVPVVPAAIPLRHVSTGTKISLLPLCSRLQASKVLTCVLQTMRHP
jgi:hypothetical protein